MSTAELWEVFHPASFLAGCMVGVIVMTILAIALSGEKP